MCTKDCSYFIIGICDDFASEEEKSWHSERDNFFTYNYGKETCRKALEYMKENEESLRSAHSDYYDRALNFLSKAAKGDGLNGSS